MSEETYVEHRRKQTSWLRPYVPGEDLDGVTVADSDVAKGSPKEGDWIARNPDDHANRWLVEASFYQANLEPVPTSE